MRRVFKWKDLQRKHNIIYLWILCLIRNVKILISRCETGWNCSKKLLWCANNPEIEIFIDYSLRQWYVKVFLLVKLKNSDQWNSMFFFFTCGKPQHDTVQGLQKIANHTSCYNWKCQTCLVCQLCAWWPEQRANLWTSSYTEKIKLQKVPDTQADNDFGL